MTRKHEETQHPGPGRPEAGAGTIIIIIATTNSHKVSEIISVYDDMKRSGRGNLPDIRFVPLNLSWNIPDAVEDGATFEANAAIKAAHYARHTGCPCLADDSGLQVDALNGQPGIHSARFAADEQPDFEALPRPQRDALNNRKLLTLLASTTTDRPWTARFVCAMCLAAPDGSTIATARGTLEGIITEHAAGDNGFGYDPIVYLPDINCTVAQLTPDQKNARSHRGNATHALLASIAHSLVEPRPEGEPFLRTLHHLTHSPSRS